MCSKRPKDLNLSVFNMSAGTNELEKWTKPVPFKCKCKFDRGKCK